MHILTKECAEYISSKLDCSHIIIDFTWFNQNIVNKNFIVDEDIELIVVLDVADPIWFRTEKVYWIKKQTKPVIFIGTPNNFISNTVPLLSWLRFRVQQSYTRTNYDNFFLSINGKTHPHRKILQNLYLNDSLLFKKGIFSFDKDAPLREHSFLPDPQIDIVGYQQKAQIIDDYQLFSMFEIVCETQGSDDEIFLSEKTVKALSTESPLFLAGCRGSLYMLKNIYGFKDFTQDDSYDLNKNYSVRANKLINLARDFYEHPREKVFNNAKYNTEHLYTKFDEIHDKVFETSLEKTLDKVDLI